MINKLNQAEKTFNDIASRFKALEHIFKVAPDILNGRVEIGELDKISTSSHHPPVKKGFVQDEAEEENLYIIDKPAEAVESGLLPGDVADDEKPWSKSIGDRLSKFDTIEEMKLPIPTSSELQTAKISTPSWVNYTVDEELVQSKIALFEQYLDESKWELNSDKDGITIHTYSGEGNQTGLSGRVILDGGFEGLMAITGSEEDMKIYNTMTEKLQVLEEIDFDTKIAHIMFKKMMVIAGREFVVLIRRHTLKDGSQALVSFSIDDYKNAPPETPGVVRAYMEVGGWYFKPLKPLSPEDNKDLTLSRDGARTLAKNFVVNDPKGSIPKFIATAGSMVHKQTLNNLRNHVRKKIKDGKFMYPEDFIELYKNEPRFSEMYKNARKLIEKSWENEDQDN